MLLKRLMMGLVFVGALAFTATASDIVIRIRPPHVVVERRAPRPSRNHVWVSGYHRWDGNAYAWNTGRWEQPPRPRGHWVAHHYVRRNGGYVLVEGYWR
jgi:WXXGXW repeat (2 copies)